MRIEPPPPPSEFLDPLALSGHTSFSTFSHGGGSLHRPRISSPPPVVPVREVSEKPPLQLLKAACGSLFLRPLFKKNFFYGVRSFQKESYFWVTLFFLLVTPPPLLLFPDWSFSRREALAHLIRFLMLLISPHHDVRPPFHPCSMPCIDVGEIGPFSPKF